MLIAAFAEAFLQYVCDCCGRSLGGQYSYRQGILQCRECAAGDHRHARDRKAA